MKETIQCNNCYTEWENQCEMEKEFEGYRLKLIKCPMCWRKE